MVPRWDHAEEVRIIAFSTLRQFWTGVHAKAEGPLKAWYAEVSTAAWQSPADIKRTYPHASIIDSERVVFNVHGNHYRLVVKVWFEGQIVYVKFVGTHAQYDKIDVREL